MGKHSRHFGFFGREGQELIAQQTVVVAGCGGNGNHVIPQLACLGVKKIIGIDDEDLSDTNRNRYLMARHEDRAPGTHKVDIAERAVRLIDKDVEFESVKASLRTRAAFEAMRRGTSIFGCFDNDGSRLVMMELACAYGIALFDLATDIPKDDVTNFGGRFSFVDAQPGCLVCRDLLDLEQARIDLESEASRKDREAIYGVPKEDLDGTGPSVVSLNGIVASLAITEFLMHVTGLRPPVRHLSYRGRTGIVTSSKTMTSSCYYCNCVKGAGDLADVQRHLISK
jgi:hypothetical protein